MLRTFTVGFFRKFKELFFTMILSMTVFDVETKVIGTEIFLQHTIADLNSSITFTYY